VDTARRPDVHTSASCVFGVVVVFLLLLLMYERIHFRATVEKGSPTCLPGGAWVGVLGLWAGPFEGGGGVGQESSYPGLKHTGSIVDERVEVWTRQRA